MRFTVYYAKAETRASIREGTQVTLSAGDEKPPVSKDDTAMHFDLPDEVGPVTLKVRVGGLGWTEETVFILESVIDLQAMQPASADKPPHPRISLTGAGGGQRTLHLDLDFIDVTEAFTKLNKNALADHLHEGKAFPGEPDAIRRIRVLERTLNDNVPRIWICCFSSKAVNDDSSLFHPFVFLRPPKNDTNIGVDELAPRLERGTGTFRYLNGPDDNAPYFLRTASKSQVDFPSKTIHCDFARQVHASGKPVVFFLPFPFNKGYQGLSRNLRRTLLSACRALFQNAIGKDAKTLQEKEMLPGIGGFSEAAPDTLAAAKASNIDLLFYVDPRGTDPDAAGLAEWFKGKDERKLVLTGGMLNDKLHKVGELLTKQTSRKVPVLPRRGHFANSPIYKAAFKSIVPIPAGQEHAGEMPDNIPDNLSHKKAPPDITRLSDDSGVFLASERNELPVRLSSLQQELRVPSTLEETEGYVQYEWLPRRRKLGSAQGSDLGGLVAELSEQVLQDTGLRHQWSVAGGEAPDLIGDEEIKPGHPAQNPPSRTTGFQGHLEFALRFFYP